MDDAYRYLKRGVSADKNEVARAIRYMDKGLYPGAFCKILPDLLGGDPSYANVMHADTAGTKPVIAYLWWITSGNTDVWHNIAQDAIVMNVDDMACVGLTQDIILSSTIGRNKHIITGEVIEHIINGNASFVERMRSLDVRMTLAGGETADVGDVVRTIDIGITATGRIRRDMVITNDIRPGQVIVGLASYGQATYESKYNSGIGSNGLTSARHDLLSTYYYDHHPESVSPETDPQWVYNGPFSLDDQFDNHIIGDLLTSPTRTYLPVLDAILNDLRTHVHGLIHNTGGGQTKVKKFIKKGRVVKHEWFPVPPVFKLIQSTSQTSWQEMYQVFNMGHRLECYVDAEIANDIIEIADKFNIPGKVIGCVEESDEKELVLRTPHGTFKYDA